MTRLISIALLIGGIILIVYGLHASDSIGSSFTRLFTGNPTDRTLWLLLGGIVATGVGTAGLLRGGKIT